MECVAFQSRVLPNALMMVEVVISLLVNGGRAHKDFVLVCSGYRAGHTSEVDVWVNLLDAHDGRRC